MTEAIKISVRPAGFVAFLLNTSQMDLQLNCNEADLEHALGVIEKRCREHPKCPAEFQIRKGFLILVQRGHHYESINPNQDANPKLENDDQLILAHRFFGG